MSIKDFIKGFIQTSKTYIAKYEEYKELSNEDKKKRVDEILFSYTKNAIETLPINFIFKIALKKFLLPNISTLTQGVFDLIEVRISGITQ